MRIVLLLITLCFWGCNTSHQMASNNMASNEILRTKDFKFGVQTKSGKLIIDTVFSRISIMNKGGGFTLPPKSGHVNEPIEYYLVRNKNKELAIFNSAGKMIFDFTECQNLYIDDKSKTIIKTTFINGLGERSQLYNLDGKLIFERDFEHIGYIDHSVLIALIAEDGANEEYYLYDPKSKEQKGPYTHFNIYGETSNPLLGMKEEDFLEYRKLNIITLRTTQNNDYVWGVIDLQGNEIFPIEYKYFRVVEEGMRKRFIDPAEKPENVNFLLYSYHINDDSSTMLLFDKEMNEYRYNHEERIIRKVMK